MRLGLKKRIEVRTYGDAVLKQAAEPIKAVDAEITALAAEMLEAMDAFDGIGIAAPQCGASKRMVILNVPAESVDGVPTPGEEALLPLMPLVLINPEIISSSTKSTIRDEGCLSVPGIYAPVERPEKVILRSGTLNGDIIEYECGGLLGRCIQHELDHLDGKVFTDRVSPETAREIAGDLKQLVKNGQKRDFKRIKTVVK